ncbi:MAG TPA: SpvB/TcaC N-terminal domain-containing protein [Jiangellales bacterium]|nr:SpvB/TcaC N-terminal domain-containing protein [Jiangellales bacterium]
MVASRPTSVLAAAVLVTTSLVATALPAVPAVLSGADGTTLGREPQITPADLGEDTLDGLRYADPAEGLDLVAPPEADSQGGAALSHPLSIPPGRAGVEPELELAYDSGGDNGWAGVGWDLSVGAVEIDTRWGTPLFCPRTTGPTCGNVESETYLLDGDVLAPTAVRSGFQPRVAERSDWTRRVETQWERIVRHGDSPKNYWWEVTDKTGTVRYYGGTPAGQRDPAAILTDAADNAVRWNLSAVKDISNNVMRMEYEKPAGQGVGAESASVGTGFYLRAITYTGTVASGLKDDPAYRVVFLRDGDITPLPDRRRDVLVDASLGVVEVTSDLLRRVEVRYGSPVAGTGARTYDQVVKAWDLEYVTGAFDKTLLSKVHQVGSYPVGGNGVRVASHTFGYHDEVKYGTGTYEGFSTSTASWATGDLVNGERRNDLNQFLLSRVGLSALGASETNSGDVRAYIGFNPTSPSKTGSFGGAFSISGGGTGGLVEMMDINGDLLPDKVYRQNVTGSAVKYRLNTSGPTGGTTFGPPQDVLGEVKNLSTEADVGIAGGAEAYFGVSVQFSVGATVTIGEDYFTDVNNDGLPDFVKAGKVYFNTPQSNGQPNFVASSAGTSVPIDDGTLDLPEIEAFTELAEQQREQSPLQDVVHRWLPPFTGTVAVTGAVSLEPPSGADYAGDGVRVAIQNGDDELWSERLDTAGSSATPSDVSSISVVAGRPLYFRVGSVEDGAEDFVDWDPTITYTSLAAATPVDANGLSQRVYSSSDDFTLAGRPGTPVLMPLEGTVRFEATFTKSAPTSDDVRLLVLHDGTAVLNQPFAAAFTGTQDVSVDFPVDGPSGSTADKVEVRIAVDSPVDPTTMSLEPRLYYLDANDGTGPVDVTDDDGNPTLTLNTPYDIDIYPRNTLTGPSTPWTSTLGRTVSVNAGLAASDGGGTAVLTVKKEVTPGQPALVVARRTVTVPETALGPTVGTGSVDVTLENGAKYWFDITVRDPGLSDYVTASGVDLTWTEGSENKSLDVPDTRHWAGRQGTFPIGHRGWAYAGYNAEGRAEVEIDQSAFEFQQSKYPDREPTGFDDTGYPDPAKGDSYPFTPYLLDVLDDDGTVVDRIPMWRGAKDNLAGGADFMSSSRTGVDSLGVGGGSAGADVRAVRRVGISAPVFSVNAGIGAASLQFAAGPSFGLLDYVDLNGDSFPDVVAPGYVQYTGPRGGYLASNGSGVDVVNQDTTFAVGGGFNGSPLTVKANSKGDANTAQDTASVSGQGKQQKSSGSAGQGGQASGQESGVNVGGSLSVTAEFTNPGSASADWNDGLSKTSLDTDAPLERELSDVNGDGLPDRVVASFDGVSVYLNLGYGFSTQPIKWAGGAFENGESYSGSVGPSLGFNYNSREFSGGVAYNEAIDQARYAWVDVDGDDVPDRVRKSGTNETKVAFGSGAGVGDEVVYGDLLDGVLELVGDIPLGEQSAQGRTRSFGGGFDFTIPIGPLCPPPIGPGCYIIVNPGAHYERSLSSTQVQLTDVDGDGYPDSVRSTDDGTMEVRSNKRGRTNLLASVDTPIGGQIRLGYTRDGNTVAQPYPIWLLSSVEVDDRRPGDGPDVQLSTFAYQGNEFNALEREMLGYHTVVETQRAYAGDANVLDDPPLRVYERRYRNATVFDSGLLVSETSKAPDGTTLARTDTEWTLVDAVTGAADPVTKPTTGAEGLNLLDEARGVTRTRVTQRWYDAAGAERLTLPLTFDYDALGNVVKQTDPGRSGTTADDLVAETTYSQCRTTSWVSVPATFTIKDSTGAVLRHRDGSPDLCLNAVPIHLEERIDGSTTAVTDLEFNAYGSYNRIAYPENVDGDRYTVEYVYDADRHTDVAEVTDSHGLTARAEYGRDGRVTRRVDANGNATTYAYDSFGRIAAIRSPYEQDPGDPATVTFEYAPSAPAYGYAVARHFDAFNPGDTIDTVAFVDGIGRLTQTKHDASILADDPADPKTAKMIVAGSIEYDALGREVKEWFPVTEPPGQATTYNPVPSPYLPTLTEYDLLDRPTKLTEPLTEPGDPAPDAKVTSTAYDFGSLDGVPGTLFTTTTTDAEGKPVRTWTDVRDTTLAVDDLPVGAARIRTSYSYDPLGQLVRVVDNAGNATTHSYDGLGRRLSTQTPDAGLRTQTWDPAGNVVSEQTPKLRAAGQRVEFAYEFDRLVGIDYPDATPDVTYVFGPPGAPGNGAGRVVNLVDGARLQQLAYDPLGNVASETTTMKVHNLNPSTAPKVTYTTGFTYDSFSRLDTLTYPDGEVLSHEYDAGGLLSGLEGEKECTELGKLVASVDATQTTVLVEEVAATTPSLPFTITVRGEQMQVTDRQPTAVEGQYAYTVVRGINGTPEAPTATSHAAGTTVTSDVPVTCRYRYLDRLEYDEFLDRRLEATGTGVLTQRSFDLLGRLENQLTETPDREIQDLVYGYDKVSNVESMQNDVPPAVPSLYVGPTTQEYDYDPYYRLESATGTYEVPQNKVRRFTWEVAYDPNGNVVRKEQTDEIANASGKGKVLVQKPTTYTFDPMTYGGAGPHQLTRYGSRTFSYDLNGNLTGFVDTVTNERRTVTWDAADRMTVVDDGSATTRYTYDDAGRRALERGPDGETSFVNRWYTVRNGSVPWKHIWAGDVRFAEKRSQTGSYEHQQYYLHQDLQGSTHMVTDRRALVFQHWEYLPGGEPWIREDSNVHRTPYLYAGGYLDEVRNLVNLGARWYEPREGVFYSPDPILATEPQAALDDPALLPAYSYAQSNPLRLTDLSGLQPDAAGAQTRGTGISASAAKLSNASDLAAFQADLARSSRLWQSLVRFSQTDKAKRLQAFSDRFDAKPLVEVNLVKTADGWSVANVKLSPFGFVQPKVYRGAADRAGKADDAAGQSTAQTGQPQGLGGPAPPGSSGGPSSATGPGAAGGGGSGSDQGAPSTGTSGSSGSSGGGGPGGAGGSGGGAGGPGPGLSSTGSSGAGSPGVGAADGPPKSPA